MFLRFISKLNWKYEMGLKPIICIQCNTQFNVKKENLVLGAICDNCGKFQKVMRFYN